MLTITMKKFLMLFTDKWNRCRPHVKKGFCFLVEFQVMHNIFLLTIEVSNHIRYTYTPQKTLFCCWIHVNLSEGIYRYSLFKYALCQWFSNILPLNSPWQEKILSPPPFFFIEIEVMVCLTFYSVYFVFFYIIFSSFLLKIKVSQY
jgi:hypothetical protein